MDVFGLHLRELDKSDSLFYYNWIWGNIMLRRYIKDRLLEEFNNELSEIDIIVDIIIELLRDSYLLNLSLEYEDWY